MTRAGEPREPVGEKPPGLEEALQKAKEGGYAVDEDGIPSMNNFWDYLPGGGSRYTGEVNPHRARMITEMDRLLKEEFPQINGEAIVKRIREIQKEIGDLMHSGKPEAEFVPPLLKLGEEAKKIEEQFRPLFNRLVELGFDIDFLQA